jgi:hypothetical protein
VEITVSGISGRGGVADPDRTDGVRSTDRDDRSQKR